MNDNELQPKSLCGLFGNSFQLVLGHFPMRFVIDPFDFAAILQVGGLRPKTQQLRRLWRRRLRCASGTCVTEISQTTFAMRSNCSLQ